MKTKKTFSSLSEAQDCLKYWKEKLFLQGWKIELVFVNSLSDDYNVLSGLCDFSINTMIAKISINTHDYFIQELTLIHELLHLKYNFMNTGCECYGSNYFDEIEHQNIEKLARTLFMVKYNLNTDYFD